MDYDAVKLTAGLEIHQQLDTHKLFSKAPSLLRSDKPDYAIMRKLHPVAGETGTIDAAALHEAGLDKEFLYEGHTETISLVELDEEPPHPINEQALTIGLQVALLLNCQVYPVTQVMRKTVIDGSNTSGFQRTVLIAHDGHLETSFGKVGIESVCLEEDSARLIERGKTSNTYRLDRLGIPLVEIATAPDMHTPEQIKEAALKLGEILRACKVKRGIGTIRQDVNVSTKGHPRVEIKGFQDPKMMITTVKNEIIRQQDAVMAKEAESAVRNALEDGTTKFLRPMPGQARMYPETDLQLLAIGRQRIDALKKNLPKLRSEIESDLQKTGLHGELLNLVLAGNVDEFLTLMKVYGNDANLVGKMVTLWRNEFAAKHKKTIEEITDVLSEAVYEKLLERVRDGKLEGGDMQEVLSRLLAGVAFEQAVEIEKLDDNEVENVIRGIIKENPGLRPNAYMGMVMGKLKGKIDAKRAMELITKLVSTN